jgi:hypothetical protein
MERCVRRRETDAWRGRCEDELKLLEGFGVGGFMSRATCLMRLSGC